MSFPYVRSLSAPVLFLSRLRREDNRTYHFQAEDDADLEAWKAVLLNVKEGALRRAFSDSAGGAELREQITRQVQSLPGNDRCVDCGSTKDVTWLATNFGIITCIECSGVHR